MRARVDTRACRVSKGSATVYGFCKFAFPRSTMRTSVTHEADPRDNEHTLPCIQYTTYRAKNPTGVSVPYVCEAGALCPSAASGLSVCDSWASGVPGLTLFNPPRSVRRPPLVRGGEDPTLQPHHRFRHPTLHGCADPLLIHGSTLHLAPYQVQPERLYAPRLQSRAYARQCHSDGIRRPVA